MAATAFQVSNRSPIAQPLQGQITQVGAGQTAVLQIPQGATYAGISIACGIGGQLAPVGAGTAPTRANLETMLTLWTLYLNGQPIWSLTGKQLIAIQEYYSPGIIGDTGIVTIQFSRDWMKDVIGMLGPDLGTLDQSNVQLRIQQDATSTITNMDVWAQVEPAAEALGKHIEYAVTGQVFGVGRQSISILAKDPAWVMYNMFIQVPDVTKVSRIEVYGDNTPIYDGPAFINQRWGQMGNPQRNPQTAKGFLNVDFCLRGLDSDPLPMNMAQFIVWLTFTADPASNIPFIQELGKP